MSPGEGVEAATELAQLESDDMSSMKFPRDKSVTVLDDYEFGRVSSKLGKVYKGSTANWWLIRICMHTGLTVM